MNASRNISLGPVGWGFGRTDFLIAVPVLVLLSLGVLDFGRAFSNQLDLQVATSEIAAGWDTASTVEWDVAVQESLRNAGVDADSVEVAVLGAELTVEYGHRFEWIGALLGDSVSSSLNLRARALVTGE
ncbi:MAG: hypothetical protein ACI8TX_000453 [Hyphomicrobiaceae bacterium]|jgi:hypothetical protein